MKNLILLAIAMAGFALTGNAQDNKFTAGVNIGVPMGNEKAAYSVSFEVDFA